MTVARRPLSMGKPAFMTPPSGRPSYVNRIEAHHRAMTGYRFMPWQRRVAQVALEHDPATGLLVHRSVVVKVPRQSGKTSLGDSVLVGRCLTWPDQMALLMAQDRNMSRMRLIDEIADRRLVGNPRYEGRYQLRRHMGSERLLFDTGSWIAIAATTAKAGHGMTLDVGFVDEFWAHEDFRTPHALQPTMATRSDPQLWLVSTEGTEESRALEFWTELGRASLDDPGSDICYFEWSKPDDADPYDESRWWEWMPALGYTIDVDAVRSAAATMPPDDFLRAYCNIRTAVTERTITAAAWDACRREVAPTGALHLGVDMNPERSRACIVATGGGVVEVVDDRTGTDWLVDRIVELDAAHGPWSIAIDKVGPAGSIISELEYRGVKVTSVDTRQHTNACGRFYDAVNSGQLAHRGQAVLDEAVAAGRRRFVADAWLWGRKGGGYIAPLVAATLAYWAWAEQPDVELVIY